MITIGITISCSSESPWVRWDGMITFLPLSFSKMVSTERSYDSINPYPFWVSITVDIHRLDGHRKDWHICNSLLRHALNSSNHGRFPWNAGYEILDTTSDLGRKKELLANADRGKEKFHKSWQFTKTIVKCTINSRSYFPYSSRSCHDATMLRTMIIIIMMITVLNIVERFVIRWALLSSEKSNECNGCGL